MTLVAAKRPAEVIGIVGTLTNVKPGINRALYEIYECERDFLLDMAGNELAKIRQRLRSASDGSPDRPELEQLKAFAHHLQKLADVRPIRVGLEPREARPAEAETQVVDNRQFMGFIHENGIGPEK
jgi:hypothetical protein